MNKLLDQEIWGVGSLGVNKVINILKRNDLQIHTSSSGKIKVDLTKGNSEV